MIPSEESEERDITLENQEIRVQKYVADCGLMSRRKAEEEILAGRIKVNGERVEQGRKIIPGVDRVEYLGRPVEKPDSTRFVYIMLHKPRGYVTTMKDELGRKTVAELVDCGCRVYPVGRLDAQSEGLLLFTNDGVLANRLMHPSGNIGKVYEVTVRGALHTAMEKLSRQIVLDGVKIQKPLVRLLRTNEEKATFEITIFEGKNRQIRRMCEAADLMVARLCRVQEGSLHLGKLPVGKWRYLTQEEVEGLKSEAK